MGKYNAIIKQAVDKMVTVIPPDVYSAIKSAAKKETGEIARRQLKTIIESIDISSKRGLPICQDTGLVSVFVNGKYMMDYLLIKEAIEEVIVQLTKEGKLRPNLVSPIGRSPIEGNVGLGEPEIYLGWEPEDSIKLILKGAGAENYSTLKMFLPSSEVHEINKFIMEKTLDADGRICPPSVVSVAVGGSPSGAMLESKKALFSKIGERNSDKKISDWETKLLRALNSLNIGPMGLGGKAGVLDVKIRVLDTHIAMMPVALTYSCWALRRIQIRNIEEHDMLSW